MNKRDVVNAGIFGTVVGDALGVPVEFTNRVERQKDPVTDMREYGTHNQPKGTWSDDSSMMLATMDSMIIRKGIRFNDIMDRFSGWLNNGDYTPYGKVFDVGITCSNAISKYNNNHIDPIECGGKGEHDNGNGALMRIMPVSLYYGIKQDYWDEDVLDAAVDYIQETTCLTHGHPRSQIGCVIYTSICHELIYRTDKPVCDVVQDAVSKTREFYNSAWEAHEWLDNTFSKEIKTDAYGRLADLTAFKKLSDEDIKSSGYVVYTLEAAVWCLLNSDSYADCVLKAVNLGDDTDTVGAVAGGLAGLCYGYKNIPEDWLEAIASKEWISGLCEDFGKLI